jgi:ubiquitin C-terminal hydrolase
MVLSSGVKCDGSETRKIQNIQRMIASIIQPSAQLGGYVSIGENVKEFPGHLRGISSQEDASEFLMHVLDVLDKIDWDVDPIEILALEFQQILRCKCGNHKELRMTERVLSIPISNDQGICSVQEMVSRFCIEETMDEPSKCQCCQEDVHFQKRMLFSKMSPVLILNIKCFDNNRAKLCPNIELSASISIELVEHGTLDYTLTAVIYHKGQTIKGGHYIVRYLQGGSWFEADNDAVVQVEGPKLSEKNTVPYLLFYTHKSLDAINGDLVTAIVSLSSGFECLPIQPPKTR